MAFGILRAYNVRWLIATMPQPTDIHARNITNAVYLAPPEDEQVMLEACRGL
jgi:hypothetical protein